MMFKMFEKKEEEKIIRVTAIEMRELIESNREAIKEKCLDKWSEKCRNPGIFSKSLTDEELAVKLTPKYLRDVRERLREIDKYFGTLLVSLHDAEDENDLFYTFSNTDVNTYMQIHLPGLLEEIWEKFGQEEKNDVC